MTQPKAGVAFDEWWAQFYHKDIDPRMVAWYAWVAAIIWVAPKAKKPWE